MGRITKIVLFLLLSSQTAFAAGIGCLGLGGSGTDFGAGGEVCTCLYQSTKTSYTGALYTSGVSYGQSFQSPGDGTNVTITVEFVGMNTTPATVEIRLDDDVDLSADTLGSDITDVSTAGEHCVEITAGSALSSGYVYYFAVEVNENYANRINNLRFANTNPYADGVIYSVPGDEWDMTGLSVPAYDLYFKVCVGADCTCP